MPKFKVTVWEQSVITYEVEADDEDKATDLINENICAYTPINEDIQDWDIEDVEEIEEESND